MDILAKAEMEEHTSVVWYINGGGMCVWWTVVHRTQDQTYTPFFTAFDKEKNFADSILLKSTSVFGMWHLKM